MKTIISTCWLVAACGGDGTDHARDGHTDSDGRDTVGDATDATIGSDGEVDTAPCAPGASVRGATPLSLCGAELVGDGEVTLSIVEAPAPFPFEHALVGHAFAIAGEGFAGTVTLPDDGAPGYRMAAVFADGAWSGFEACPVAGGLRFPVGPGTWALWRDVNVYPSSPQGLGEGTIGTELEGEHLAWTFEAGDGGAGGYAIHDVGPDGLRSVTLIARRAPVADALQQLDVRLVETAAHTFTVLQVTLLDSRDTSGGWSWLEPVDGPLTDATVADDDDRTGWIHGTFDAPLRKGDARATIHVELDVATGRYRFPPEGACFPDG